ncbi:NEW3 domain-containing protein [Paenibacillus sp. KQZ6P-2]|uniref:NEW3 domain-containing protein n=1 Tax=Paenibacillus mangrovi TaxID=2931978 RepID=A0A9X2B575_9BACL|nr:NEW3 domain-containing protein [Paenibacillus mangrovi]MCJ8012377.1 NEW3 domain-containing protein [Paenibacillus mangrovi]
MTRFLRNIKLTSLLLIFTLVVGPLLGVVPAHASGGVSLYTTYTSISVPPGESLNYNVELRNNTDSMVTVPLAIKDLPKGWTAKMTGDGWDLNEISVMPNTAQSISLAVTVPMQIDKGTYHFTLTAGSLASLPLTVQITEKGTYQTELTTDQANLEGHSDATFTYSVNLTNRTAEKQTYALTAQAEPGWDVTFSADGKQVSSVEVDPGASKAITVDIKPAENVTKGTFKIPIRAANQSTNSELVLEAAISGKYSLELTTPSGLLSTDVKAGGDKTVELQVKNTGTADLTDINLTSTTPSNWEVTFNPKTIDKLAAGKSTTVEAKITSSDKAIAGDYVTDMTAQAAEASATATFRVAIKGSVLWGWIGVLIILAIFGGIYVLIRKYGRR